MYQELGVSCRHWELLGCLSARQEYWRRSPTDSFRRHSTFYIYGQVETTDLDPRPGEISQARWFDSDAFPEDRSDSLDVAAAAGWLRARPHADAASAHEPPLDP
jgi:isopentenyldiphosphate isomerase